MIALKTTIQTLTMTYIRSTLRYYYTYIHTYGFDLKLRNLSNECMCILNSKQEINETCAHHIMVCEVLLSHQNLQLNLYLISCIQDKKSMGQNQIDSSLKAEG